jgi:glycyl-tRNA synthetase beta chain
MRREDLLIELGTEELPPKSLRALRDAFAAGVAQELTAARLDFGIVTAYATPRRLAVKITDVLAQQPDQVEEKLGPALAAAFTAEGTPTQAALGFARGCGVEVAALKHVGEGKQARLVHRMLRPGESTAALLPALVSRALDGLPIPKRMRWGVNRHEFVRPVHWLVLLFGTEIVPGEVLGTAAGRHSRGHRFHAPAPIALTCPADYPDCLESAFVLADFDRRRARIEAGVMAAATASGGKAILDPALLDEVTALTEWPVPLVGSFEKRFLDVPAEALIASMKGHQKYFPVEDADGRLLNHFIALANLASRDPVQVIDGNERVIRPRLTDAAFFFEQDCKQPLADRFERLRSVTFQVELGSLADKTERVIALAGWIAERIGADPALARRAARLSKCDLMTEMVGEFDELQGIMGAHYARRDGEPEEVALALREQYLPAFAGDALPTALTGCVLGLADRLDTLVGIFGIGQPPTGSRDPFGLRRAAIGVLRILIERGLELDLRLTLEQARAGYGSLKQEPADAVRAYILERLRAIHEDQGIPAEVFLAVMARDPATAPDFDQRIRAVDHFRRLPEAAALAAAQKRVANILAKSQADATSTDVDPVLLQEPAEQVLFEALAAKRTETEPLLMQRDYTAVLSALATLRAPVDAFFDTVLVNAEDPALRANRLALLTQLRALFWEVADIALLPAAR